jgi:RNA polymerase sigma-70 factor, ECF subfamily
MRDFPIKNDQLQFILKELKKGSPTALKELFDIYAEKLYCYALRYVNKPEIAEEVVQDVFIAIWETRNKLTIKISLESYLYTSIKNRSISYLRKRISEIKKVELLVADQIPDEFNQNNGVEYQELKTGLKKVIETLPERCRIIFYLSRNSGLSYKQIAKELNISPETVKTQIGIALNRLKIELKKFVD